MAEMAGNMEAAKRGIPFPEYTFWIPEAATGRIPLLTYGFGISDNDDDDRRLFEDKQREWREDVRDLLGIETFERLVQAWRNPRRMSINVEHVNGERFKIDVVHNDTLQEIKRKVAKRVNMSEDECILLYRRKELDGCSFLYQTDIQDGSTINLLPRTGNGLLDTVTWLFTGASKTISNLVDWVPGFFRDTSKTLTEKDLGRIANAIGRGWEVLGNELGLAPALIDQISEDKNSTVTRILYMLLHWRIQNPFEATVGNLRLAMKACSQVTFNWKAINRVFTGI